MTSTLYQEIVDSGNKISQDEIKKIISLNFN